MLIRGYWLNESSGEQYPIIHTTNLLTTCNRVMKPDGRTVDYFYVRIATDGSKGQHRDHLCQVSSKVRFLELREHLKLRNTQAGGHEHTAPCYVALCYTENSCGYRVTWVVAIGATLDEMVAVE